MTSCGVIPLQKGHTDGTSFTTRGIVGAVWMDCLRPKGDDDDDDDYDDDVRPGPARRGMTWHGMACQGLACRGMVDWEEPPPGQDIARTRTKRHHSPTHMRLRHRLC